jgi:hypothetical protein
VKPVVPELDSSIERRLQLKWSHDGFSFVLYEADTNWSMIAVSIGLFGVAPAVWLSLLSTSNQRVLAFLICINLFFLVSSLVTNLSWSRSVTVLVNRRGLEFTVNSGACGLGRPRF